MVTENNNVDSRFLSALQQGLELVEKISQTRQKADTSMNTQENVGAQVVGYYTTTIAFLLDSVLESTKLLMTHSLPNLWLLIQVFFTQKSVRD